MIRTYLLYKIFSNSKETALATRDANGDPNCDNCKSTVSEGATRCPHCQSHLYTRRGKFTRRLFFWGAIAITIYAFLRPTPTTAQLLIQPLLFAISGYMFYIWLQLRGEKPNREIQIQDKM